MSPALAAAACTGTVPVLAIDQVHWAPVEGGPMPIALTGDQTRTAGTSQGLAELLYDDVVATTVAPVLDAVRQEFSLSPKVLWGDVASALDGAAEVLAAGPSDLPSRPTQLADQLLQKGFLVGSGCYVQPDPVRMARHFVRANCCLFYRMPNGGTCADCVLVPGAARLLANAQPNATEEQQEGQWPITEAWATSHPSGTRSIAARRAGSASKS